MTQSKYDAATAKALMELAHGECKDEATAPYIQRESGLYVNESFRAVCPPGTIFDWTPADDMEWPGSPNPDTAPFLPIPFTASELAACMLDGPGQSIQFALDKRIGYPLKDGALGSIRARHRWMREALQEAYDIAAAAQLVVGEFDHEEEARAHALAQQYDDANGQANELEGVFEQGITRNEASARRARAVASVADLKAQAERAQAAVADKWKAWRKAMVRQLLWAESRRTYIARKLEETQSDEYKKLTLVVDAVFERLEKAKLKLERRQAILNSPETLCVPIGVAEADVEKALREVADAEHDMRVMRGDCDDSRLMGKELGSTQTAVGYLPDMKTEPEREAEQFWFCNVSLDLEHWATLADVSAREAAMLLCLHHPTKTTFDDAKTTMRTDLPERHLERLDRSLSDYAAQNPRPCRSLLGWYSAAQEMQIKLAPEAVLFMGYVAAKSNATPAPVRNGASNAPMDGITTKQVAAIFDGFHYTAENWPRRLSDTKWLKPAQVALGAVGGATSLWCPATLARLIHGKERVTAKQKMLEALNKKFKSNTVLEPWRTKWDEHYQMFNDADANH